MSPNVFASVWGDIKDKLKEVAWAALLVVLKWLLERWASNPGGSSRDADPKK